MMAERVSPNSVTNHLVLFGISDRGLQRENNEDHFMVVDLTRKVIGVRDNQLRPELLHHEVGAGGTILLVADGLGGHEGGEIASQLAVDTVAQALLDIADQTLPIGEQLVHAVDVAHEAICKYHGAKGRTRHMASTLTAVHVGPSVMTIAQVGDSRAYRLSSGKLTLLTDDQTVVHMMQKKGMLSAEEAQNHPHRNIILQALGQDKSVLPELQTLSFQHNDCILLCSDGLSSYVEHAQIEAIMASGEDEHVRCRRLVEAANGAGGADNVTVLLARLVVKDGVRPEERKVVQPAAPQPAERPHKSIWATAVQLPQDNKARSKAESRAEEKDNRAPRTLVMRSPWSTKEAQPPVEPALDLAPPVSTPAAPASTPPAPVSAPSTPPSDLAKPVREVAGPTTPPPSAPNNEPPKLSIWRREIKWPWGGKATPPAVPSTPRPAEEARGSGQAGDSPWEPAVLKALEENLARYIGPVAKVLVTRAAHRTKDFPELCQALAAQLSAEQERDSFLRSVARYNPARSRRS